MYYNAILGVFGAALICGARDIGMFLAGRFFAGMSAFGFLVLTPVFTSELSPPKLRGLFCGLNGFFIGLGYCKYRLSPFEGTLSYSQSPRSGRLDGCSLPLH